MAEFVNVKVSVLSQTLSSVNKSKNKKKRLVFFIFCCIIHHPGMFIFLLPPVWWGGGGWNLLSRLEPPAGRSRVWDASLIGAF